MKIVTPPPGSKTVTIIDGSSGKTQEVTIPGNAEEKTPKTPGEANGAVKDAPDPKLSEPSRHGAIPVIGPNGARVSAVFAHPRAIAGGQDATRRRSPSSSAGSASAPPAPPMPSPSCRRR